MQQPWTQPTPWTPQVSAGSAGSGLPGPAGRLFARKKRSMTSISIDSRKCVAGTDSDFEFDIGETVHLQGSARLGVFKIRVADTFLSTDRGTYLYWRDTALVGAYTGIRLAAWISSNFASATYVESRNELEVAYDGKRLILNDAGAVSRKRKLPPRRHAQQDPEHQSSAAPQLRQRGGQSSPLCRCSRTQMCTSAAAAWPTPQTPWGCWATTSSPRSSASRAWATSWRRTPTKTTWST